MVESSSPRSPSPPSAVVGTTGISSDNSDNIMEGFLLKQGSRSRSFWHERYFILSGDNKLIYFHKKRKKHRQDSSQKTKSKTSKTTNNNDAATPAQTTTATTNNDPNTDSIRRGENLNAGNDSEEDNDNNNNNNNKPSPKMQYDLNKLAHCEVSELFVETYHKELVYCIRITWATDTSARSTAGESYVETTSAGDTRGAGGTNSPATTGGGGGSYMDDSSSIGVLSNRGYSSEDNNGNTSLTMSPAPQSGAAAGAVSHSTTSSKNNSKKGLRRGRFGRKPKQQDNTTTNPPTTSPSCDEQQDGMPQIPTLVEVADDKQRRRQRSDQPQLDGSALATTPVSTSSTGSNDVGSEATMHASNRTAKNHVLSPYDEQEREYLRSQYLANKKKSKRRLVHGTQLAAAAGTTVGLAVVTAGISVMAGLVVLGVGAAAGGGGAAFGGLVNRKKITDELVIASADYETIKSWRSCIEASLESNQVTNSTWGQLFFSTVANDVESKTRRALVSTASGELIAMKGGGTAGTAGGLGGAGGATDIHSRQLRKVKMVRTAKWRPLEGGWISFLGTGVQGLRIFREEIPTDVPCRVNGAERPQQHQHYQQVNNDVSIDGKPCRPMKAHTVLSASPLDAFLCLMSYGQQTSKQQSGGQKKSSSRQSNPSEVNSDNVDGDDDIFFVPNSEQRSAFRIIENIDDNADVIHLVFQPLYLFPSWTSPRDFCLYRYWRLEPDGSFIVCYESVVHPRCPTIDGYVRGEMHQVFTIAPPKKSRSATKYSSMNKYHNSSSSSSSSHHHHHHYHNNECLMTAVVQIDPKGWVPTTPLSLLWNQSYGEAFTVSALLQLLDIRDAIDLDRFIRIPLDRNEVQDLMMMQSQTRQHQQQAYRRVGDSTVGVSASSAGMVGVPPYRNGGDVIMRNTSNDSGDMNEDHGVSYDFSYADREALYLASTMQPHSKMKTTGIIFYPPPLQPNFWAEPDSNSFLVRGKNYKHDRKKQNAGPGIGRLFAVDLVSVDKPVYSGFSRHPTERIQRALQRELVLKSKGIESDMPSFVFVVNLVLPGPPFYHAVFYYAVDDRSTIDGSDGTPSSKLCKEFFFGGENNEYCDKTFKLIPQIVQGNFIVRKAVGSTPAVIGKKLRQLYVRNERYFEVIMDCGSSPVATGVIRLSLGYAKTLVVDMGFLLEGDDEETLPERIFGCVRMKNIVFDSKVVRHVIAPTNQAEASSSRPQQE